ncbi:type II CRISPR RNA-guided endonuclease Cas9 [Floccifex sp.]|uniref:type II CRISPR RNA-guided endonuclease Cas9 n=1 Tax=Floccifex sp. TaxID=2815810 RepID=UPI003F10350D
MTKLVLGLDIGITSVGYGIIDIDNNSFVDYGVRLFKEGTAANNEDRRNARGRRRLTRRKANRIEDMKKLLKENDIMSDDYKPQSNVYELRVKGLTNKLTKDELVSVILHLTKHRGSSIETVDEMEDTSSDSLSTKEILSGNAKLLKEGKYICEVQLDRLHDDNKVRGHANNFKTEDYVKEAKQILSNQGLDEEVNDKIIEIISRKRAYYEGPGSEKSPTPYGRWFYDENGEIVYEDLIERMRGKCSVFPNEFRAPKMSVSAEIFNLLNDINNLSIEDEKLDVSKKQEIFSYISKNKKITPKQLSKILGVDEDKISGFRIDKNNKHLLTEFKGYTELKKAFEKENIDISLNDYELLDAISEILTNYKGIEERKEKLSLLNIDEKVIEQLVLNTKFVGYHSLSLKAIRLLNEELYKTSLNQIQILHQLKLFDKARISHRGKKNIVADDMAILSPVAKRAQNETFKVVNALRKKYGEFDSIVVEMTRDKNDAERKKRISDSQKYFENRNKEVDKLLKDRGLDPEKINGKTKTKIRLYLEQDGKSAYTFQPIDLDLLIKDRSYTEIDHIIPISISLDDSQSNKVLITRMENQLKGNLTPFMAYQSGKFDGLGCSWSKYKAVVENNKKLAYKKKKNLLYDKDITKFDNIQEFINRNLIDTSYACRTVLNTLTDYFKDNEIDIKVHTVNGKITDKFRTQIQLNKVRDEDFLHHAIDALIVASVKKMNLLNGYLSKYTFDNFYDELTGEIKDIPDEKAYMDPKYIAFIAQLKEIYLDSNRYYKGQISKDSLYYPPIKISHKVDTKPNRQIANETIYSTRKTENGEMLIERVKDIYASKDKQVTKMIEDIINHESSLLMKDNDPQTYNILEDIVMHDFEMYKDSKEHYKKEIKKGVTKYKLVGENPFIRYKEEFGPIRKYSKKGNGPEIHTLKFYSEKLGNHLDITGKYDTEHKKVILKQISPYRTDFYKCSDGKFRFVTVRYKDVRFEGAKGKYVIDSNWYELEKNKKKIDNKAEFICSCHRDELIGIVKKQGDKYIYDDSTENGGMTLYHDGLHPEILKFTATNNDQTGQIEVKPLFTYCKKRLMPTVTSLVNICKYSTDVLGNMYEVKENKLKLEFD